MSWFFPRKLGLNGGTMVVSALKQSPVQAFLGGGDITHTLKKSLWIHGYQAILLLTFLGWLSDPFKGQVTSNWGIKRSHWITCYVEHFCFTLKSSVALLSVKQNAPRRTMGRLEIQTPSPDGHNWAYIDKWAHTKKKRPYFPWHTGCLIGIHKLVYCNPHITG